MKKRVLIITYYWPPAGGPGVQRWLKFVKYLPEFGIEPVVYIPENAHYPIIDNDLEKEIGKDVEIIRYPIKEPYKMASLFSKKSTKDISSGIIPVQKKQKLTEKALLWIRGNFFIPDARIGWVNPSVSFLEDYLKKHPVDSIITTGPPHSVHLIGLKLKKMFSINWLSDFRDPWTTIGYHKELKLTDKAAQKHKELEKKVLNTADHIIVTSPTTKREFEQITKQPVSVITNGYDIERIQKQPLDKEFTIAHIGSLLSNRNPRVLWKALAELIKEEKGFKDHFRLKLIGKISEEILSVLKEFHLEAYVHNMGYLSHTDALIQQRTSQVLLLLEIDSEDTVGIIPGKLFEYMAAERPILSIGPEGADFSEIIRKTNTGVFHTYEDKEAIKQTLIHYYHQYLDQNLKIYGMGLQYYSRRKLTEKLAALLMAQ